MKSLTMIAAIILISVKCYSVEQTQLVITSYNNIFSGEYSEALISNVLTLENLSEASVYHYVFQDEDEVDSICYKGDANDVIKIIEEILNASTGDSWQELGEPQIQKGTVIYPYTYVGESGESGELEAIVSPCASSEK